MKYKYSMETDQKQNAGPTAKEYTGEGFIPISDLTETVTAYQLRQKLCEEVDYLESRGGLSFITLGEAWLLNGLKTDKHKGIDSRSVEKRIDAYGSNQIAKKELSSFLDLMVEALKDLTLIILMIAAVISIIVQTIVEVDHRSTGSI